MNDDTLVRLDRPGPEQAAPVRDDAQLLAATGRASSRSTATAIQHASPTASRRSPPPRPTTARAQSTSFVVRVVSDLSDLKVNGQAADRLPPGRHDYDVIAPGRRDDRAAGRRGHRATPARCASRRRRRSRARRPSRRPARTASSRPTRSTSRTPAKSDEFDGSTLDPQWTVGCARTRRTSRRRRRADDHAARPAT